MQNGALFLNGESGPQLAAQIGNHEGAGSLMTTVRGFIETELHDGKTATATVFDVLAPRPATEWMRASSYC
ncbi:MAG TPA: hypothetical protein VJV78_37835 [Polyangiales bacterium]|nr:hypothetical protein [Polyangiales bacterium]